MRHLVLAVLLIVGCLLFLTLAAVMAPLLPMIAGLTLVVGSLAYRSTHARERREARLANGLCVRCGYDLRATPDRCPECGTART